MTVSCLTTRSMISSSRMRTRRNDVLYFTAWAVSEPQRQLWAVDCHGGCSTALSEPPGPVCCVAFTEAAISGARAVQRWPVSLLSKERGCGPGTPLEVISKTRRGRTLHRRSPPALSLGSRRCADGHHRSHAPTGPGTRCYPTPAVLIFRC